MIFKYYNYLHEGIKANYHKRINNILIFLDF